MPWTEKMGPLASAQEAAALVKTLFNSYPTEVSRFLANGIDLIETGAFYAEEFQHYPADWVREALRRLRRERSQFPSIADFCEMVRVVGGWVNG